MSLIGSARGEPQDRVRDYRRDLVAAARSADDQRPFDELSRKPDAPFLNAGSTASGLTPTSRPCRSAPRCRTARSRRASRRSRSKRSACPSGFGAGGARAGARSGRWPGTSGPTPSATRARAARYVQEYISKFLEESRARASATSIGSRKQRSRPWPPRKSTPLASAVSATSRVILAVSPEKAGVRRRRMCSCKAALTATEAVAVTAWNDTATARDADGASRRSRRPSRRAATIAELGVTVVALRQRRRGMVQADRLQERPGAVLADGAGGTSLAPPDKYTEAQLATSLGRAVRRRRPQRGGSPEAPGGKDRRGLTLHHPLDAGHLGSSTPANLETALQLLNLNFTAPGDDPRRSR